MPYIIAHPIGYQKLKRTYTKKESCRNVQCTRVQTIVMTTPVSIPLYDKKGNRIGSVEHIHKQIKTIYHKDISHKSGYTLAEAYWNSVLNSPNYGVFTNKYRKRSVSLAD